MISALRFDSTPKPTTRFGRVLPMSKLDRATNKLAAERRAIKQAKEG